VITPGRRGALLDVGTPGFVAGLAGDIGGCEPVVLAPRPGGSPIAGRPPGWLGLIVPSGSVAGGEEPVPAGVGEDPTAADGITNARFFAVDGDSIGGATGGMGAVDVTIR
jgi:hypothetical protein